MCLPPVAKTGSRKRKDSSQVSQQHGERKGGKKMSQMAVLKSASATSSYNPAQSDKRLTVPVWKLASVLPLPSSLELFLLRHLSDVLQPWGGGRREKNLIPWPAASSRGGDRRGGSLLSGVAFKISRKRKVMFIKWRQRRGATCSDSNRQTF